jgi:hypothetical protein
LFRVQGNETMIAMTLPHVQVRKRRRFLCVRHLNITTIILPRQARDKHRESSTQKERGIFYIGAQHCLATALHAAGDGVGARKAFLEPFTQKNEHLTKAGSGQT